MKLLSRTDIRSALVTGLTTGVIAWRILVFLDKGLPLGINPMVLVPLVPVLWLAGVQLGYMLAAVAAPFAQFGKFVAIGFTNAMVDFGALYILIGTTGYADGLHYALFKAVSFSVATVHSYYWNKSWAFAASRSHGGSTELIRFLTVAVASILVNVAAASVVVAVGPLGGLDVRAWAGIGAIVGSATALIFSFIGFRLFVFSKK
jgi:putative flippase GtrA